MVADFEPLTPEREQELVRAAKNGDRTAADELLRGHLPPVHAFIRLRGGGRLPAVESTEDVLQSVMRTAVEKFDEFDWRGEASFRNWLLTLAQNRIASKGRYHAAKRRAHDRVEDHASLSQFYDSVCRPSRIARGREAVEHFEAAFAELPDDYREVIVLARIEKLGHAEIAARLGKSEGASRQLLSRALVRLASRLAELEG